MKAITRSDPGPTSPRPAREPHPVQDRSVGKGRPGMSILRNAAGRWFRTIAVALAFIPVVGLLSTAAETEKSTARAEVQAKKAKRAREALASLKSLDEAVKKERRGESSASPKV